MPETTLYIRMKQAINWLKRNKSILQKDIADKMGMAEASFTRALMRTKEKNDEDFVIAFHSVTSEYFSLDYLLTGNGDLICENEKVASAPSIVQTSSMDFSFYIEKAVEKATAYSDKMIAIMETQVADKNKEIERLEKIGREKDDMIALMQKRIQELEAVVNFYKSGNQLRDYPFDMGVAEVPNTPENKRA